VEIRNYEFGKLPFSSLFRDYLSGKPSILQFYDTPPFDSNRIEKKIQSFQFSGNREKLAEQLHEFNAKRQLHENSRKNIDRLKEPDSLAVVTGQQVTLYGGPLYTIYKTLSAIEIARSLEEKYKRPVVPVFWLADEDHDADEIASIGLMKGDERVECGVDLSSYQCRSAEIPLSRFLQELKSCRDEHLFHTDFTDELKLLLDRHYRDGVTAGEAFGGVLMELFGKYGLVLAGSNSEGIKKETVHILKQSVTGRSALYESLEKRSRKLEKEGYHSQVVVQQSNLFYIDRQNQRVKLTYSDGSWSSDGKVWSDDELLREIENEPNRFSPNVFLRPMLQDALLPVIGYVGGPGEIAYYAQLGAIYPIFNQSMPVIFPRYSVTLIESAVDRILDKLPFSIADYGQRIEDLESNYIQQDDQPDVESIFNEWKKSAGRLSEEFEKSVAEIDPTLRKSAGKASAAYFTELDKLKGKVYRSLKEQERVQINRISKIKMNLFPGDALQERQIAFIYFMNKYGLGIWDEMLAELHGEESRTHKLITL
jgi:bacillithiol synthase